MPEPDFDGFGTGASADGLGGGRGSLNGGRNGPGGGRGDGRAEVAARTAHQGATEAENARQAALAKSRKSRAEIEANIAARIANNRFTAGRGTNDDAVGYATMGQEFDKFGFWSTVTNHAVGLVPGINVQAKVDFNDNTRAGNDTTFGVAEAIGDVVGLATGIPALGYVTGKLDTKASTFDVADVTSRSGNNSSPSHVSGGPGRDTLNDNQNGVPDRQTERTGLLPPASIVERAKAPTGLLSAENMAYLNQPKPSGGQALNRYQFDPELGRIVRM